MKTDQTHEFLYMVWSQKPAKVEVDEIAGAAYIRFNSGKVARTEVKDDNGVLVTMDYDALGNVFGAELVGVSGFGLQSFNTAARGKKRVRVRRLRPQHKRPAKMWQLSRLAAAPALAFSLLPKQQLFPPRSFALRANLHFTRILHRP